MSEKTSRKPLRLLKNKRYPTYQLYAHIANKKTPPETALLIAVAQTMQWLRERFREFEIPEQLNFPTVDDCGSITTDALKSFSINEGYKVEVLWLPLEKNWSLLLTEPDLGPSPGEQEQSRAPVPGRIIESDIAYRITGGSLECGFRTIISQPECSDEICEVFRYGFIKHLARNPLIGLEQGYQLTDEPLTVDTSAKIERLSKWLKSDERTLPAIIYIDKTDDVKPDITALHKMRNINIIPPPELLKLSLPEQKPSENKPKITAADVKALARYKMGYAQYFIISAAKAESFAKECACSCAAGDLVLREPEVFGGDIKIISVSRQRRELKTVMTEIDSFAQNYPLGKPVNFGNVLFIPQAKQVESIHTIELSESKAELLAAFKEREQAEKDILDDRITRLEECISLSEAKNKRLQGLCDEKDAETAEKLAQADNRLEELKKELLKRDEEIARFRFIEDRPKTPQEVSGWVNLHFENKLFFHQKAVDLLSKINPSEVDMPLLCDALEYLATEYRDRLTGAIDETEHNLRCSNKYGRPFDVTPCGDLSSEAYPADYKIKYYPGYNGKPVESPLDLHLRVGVDSEKLLRIYFLYDKKKQLIVVGSLPKHLKTLNFK